MPDQQLVNTEQLLFKHLSEGVLHLDAQKKIITINPEAEKITRWSAQNIRRRNAHDVLCANEGRYAHSKAQCPLTKLVENEDLDADELTW